MILVIIAQTFCNWTNNGSSKVMIVSMFLFQFLIINLKIDWKVEGEKKKMVIEKMENDPSPKLRENIIEDFYLTPDYFKLNTKYVRFFNQPKFSQSAYFRFHNKSVEIYDGLYLLAAGTHPGAGVPGVLSSAKVLDKII